MQKLFALPFRQRFTARFWRRSKARGLFALPFRQRFTAKQESFLINGKSCSLCHFGRGSQRRTRLRKLRIMLFALPFRQRFTARAPRHSRYFSLFALPFRQRFTARAPRHSRYFSLFALPFRQRFTARPCKTFCPVFGCSLCHFGRGSQLTINFSRRIKEIRRE